MPDKAEVPFELDGGDDESARAYSTIIEDPLYGQAMGLVQQGRWAEAEDALAELGVRYPSDAGLARAQRELALHLSAERTWVAGAPKPRSNKRVSVAAPVPRTRAVRVLIAGNLVLYSLVAMTWLLLQLKLLFR